ncbi:tetratricopeptide repeat protein [Amycolatopsis thailandensis]|uniref:phosphorylase family protein n=1 Tax=Amycolatopsis thailandensis TaxID=589330 RepID=UPI003790899D
MTTGSDTTNLGTVVICTALDVEYQAVRDHLHGSLKEKEGPGGTLYEIGTFPTDRGSWTVALAQSGAGNTQAGIEIERAITVFRPRCVLFVGVAGGRKDVALGDVVIADYIYDYDTGKDTATGRLPRIKTHAPANRLLRRAQKLARDREWQHRILPRQPETMPEAIVKPIAAGSTVVADLNSATAHYLDRHCGDAAAVEMEGFGFLHGAYANDAVEALVVRGISDLLSGKTETADQHWQPTASQHAAAFAFELLANVTPPPAPHTPPRQLHAAPARFVGRESELTELTAQLDARTEDGGAVMISSLAGTGGIGKTWLALHWAHQNINRFPDGQLFVDLHGFSPSGEPMTSGAAVRGFLAALGVAPDRIPPDLDAQAALYRSEVAGKRMLVMLDNAATTDQITPLLPGSPTCTVLITGRHKLASLIDRHGARHLTLGVLTRKEARALLAERVGADRAANEPDAIDELVDLCGRYPLALAIAARNASTRPGIPLAEVAAELRELGLEMLDHDTDPAASLPAVLSWSLRYLTDEQRTVFALLSITPGPDTTLPAVVSLANLPSSRTRSSLSALEEACLVERQAYGRYAMHDLVREYATTIAHALPTNICETARARVVDFYLHTAHNADRLLNPHRHLISLGPCAPGCSPQPLRDPAAALAWMDREHACVLAIREIATASGRYEAVWQSAWVLGTFHDRRGLRHDNLAVWRTALDAAHYLPDPATRIRIRRLLGHAYAIVGRHEDAIEHLSLALALAEHHRVSNEQADTNRTLARAWGMNGNDHRALEHARVALRLYKILERPAAEAQTLNLMGHFAARLGDYHQARERCQSALILFRLRRNLYGEANALDNLGYIARQTGSNSRALDHYQEALALRRVLGHLPQAANNLDSIGLSHVALGQLDQARVVWLEALELYREQGRDDAAASVQQQLDNLDAGNQSTPRPGGPSRARDHRTTRL